MQRLVGSRQVLTASASNAASPSQERGWKRCQRRQHVWRVKIEAHALHSKRFRIRHRVYFACGAAAAFACAARFIRCRVLLEEDLHDPTTRHIEKSAGNKRIDNHHFSQCGHDLVLSPGDIDCCLINNQSGKIGKRCEIEKHRKWPLPRIGFAFDHAQS